MKATKRRAKNAPPISNIRSLPTLCNQVFGQFNGFAKQCLWYFSHVRRVKPHSGGFSPSGWMQCSLSFGYVLFDQALDRFEFLRA